MRRLLAMTLACCTCLASRSAPAGTVVYVAVSGENRIDVYSQDAATGGLTRTSQHPVDGSPGALTTDAQRKFLFAALRPEGRLLSFQISPGTGALELLSMTDAKTDPAHVSVDLTGQWLLAAYYPSGEVSTHRVERDGRLAIRGRFTRTAANAHAIVVHPRTNAYVLVPHTSSERIQQFRFNPLTGELTPNTPPLLQTPDRTGPRHLVFHPARETAYISHEQGGSVGVYEFSVQTGLLKPVQTVRTLPEDFTADNACSEIRITPNGKFVFVANRGHDSLAAFRVDSLTGQLEPLGQTPTEATPRSFDIDPSGKYVYVAGESSGRLAVYALDDATGALTLAATHEVGQAPWWVLAINTP